MDKFTNYSVRREFTDKVHEVMATKVYNYLNWDLDIDSRGNEYKKEADMNDGIDYFVNINGFHRTVQERFRRASSARDYKDITLRYQYPGNTTQVNSEWFRITADYFLYGVVPVERTSDVTQNKKFSKLVVIDLRVFTRLVDDGKIAIGDNRTSSILNGILYGGLNFNKVRPGDNQSTFVAFDVMHLYDLDPDLVVVESGYGTPKDIRLK